MDTSNSIQVDPNDADATVPLVPKSEQNEVSMSRGKLGCIVGGSCATAFLIGAMIMYGTADNWHSPNPIAAVTGAPSLAPTTIAPTSVAPTTVAPTISSTDPPRYQAQEDLRNAVLSEFPDSGNPPLPTPSTDPRAQCLRENPDRFLTIINQYAPYVVITTQYSGETKSDHATRTQTVQGDCNPDIEYTAHGPFAFVNPEIDDDDYPNFLLAERPANPTESYTVAENQGMFTSESFVDMLENADQWWAQGNFSHQMGFGLVEDNGKFGMNLLVDITCLNKCPKNDRKFIMDIDYNLQYPNYEDVWKGNYNFYGDIDRDIGRQYFYQKFDRFADHNKVWTRLNQFNAQYGSRRDGSTPSTGCSDPQECLVGVQDLMKDLSDLAKDHSDSFAPTSAPSEVEPQK